MVKPRLRVPAFSRVLAASGRGAEFTQPRFYLLVKYCRGGRKRGRFPPFAINDVRKIYGHFMRVA